LVFDTVATALYQLDTLLRWTTLRMNRISQVADLIRHALDRTALATQAHMSCDNAGRKVRCNLKLAFKVQTETTHLALTIGFVMSLLLAHCTRVLCFRAPIFAVDLYAVLGVLQLATLVFAACWAFFAFSTVGSAFVRCVIGQAMCVEVKRMELVAEPEDGPQSFQVCGQANKLFSRLPFLDCRLVLVRTGMHPSSPRCPRYFGPRQTWSPRAFFAST